MPRLSAPSVTAPVSSHPCIESAGLLLPTPRLNREKGFAPQAKADLTNREMVRRQHYGRLLGRALSIAGLSIKEAAAQIGEACGRELDPAQLSHWIAGAERMHIDAVLAAQPIARPFTRLLAVDQGAELETRLIYKEDVA